MSQDDDKKTLRSMKARLATIQREMENMGGYRLELVSALVAATRSAVAMDARQVRYHLKNVEYWLGEMDDPLSDFSLETLHGMASNIMYWSPEYAVDLNSLHESGARGYKSVDPYFRYTSVQIFRLTSDGVLRYVGGAENFLQLSNTVAQWQDFNDGDPDIECLVMFDLDREECRYDEVGQFWQDGWKTPNLAHLRTLENKSQVTVTIEDEEFQVTVWTARNTGDFIHLRPDWELMGETKDGQPFNWDQARDGGSIRLYWGSK